MIALRADDTLIELPQKQKNNEWYTPSRYIEAARLVMGGIDLDPASCALANKSVKAKQYYTMKDDGLSKQWRGRVWLNPPFGNYGTVSNIGLFTRKLLDEYRAENVSEAILFTVGNTQASWFVLLWDFTICFIEHEMKFVNPYKPGERFNHRFGGSMTYLGPNEQRFIEVFSQFGTIIPAGVAVRRQQITPLRLWEVSE